MIDVGLDLEFYLWESLQAGLIDAINEVNRCCYTIPYGWQEGRNWIGAVAQSFAADTWEMRGFS